MPSGSLKSGDVRPHFCVGPLAQTSLQFYESISSHSWSSPPRFTILHRGVGIALFCSQRDFACRECASVTRSCCASPNPHGETSHDRYGIKTATKQDRRKLSRTRAYTHRILNLSNGSLEVFKASIVSLADEIADLHPSQEEYMGRLQSVLRAASSGQDAKTVICRM